MIYIDTHSLIIQINNSSQLFHAIQVSVYGIAWV